MNPEQHSTYTTDELIQDDDFRAFVLCSSDEKVLQEFDFLSDEKKDNVYLAIRIIRSIHVAKRVDTSDNKELVWQRIIRDIAEDEGVKSE